MGTRPAVGGDDNNNDDNNDDNDNNDNDDGDGDGDGQLLTTSARLPSCPRPAAYAKRPTAGF